MKRSPGFGYSLEALSAVLQHEERTFRRWACSRLASYEEAGIEPLVGVLDDADPYLAEDAANRLIALGEPAVEPLLQRLAVVDEALGRQLAIRGVASIRDPRCVEPLLALVEPPVPLAIRRVAAFYLGRPKDRCVEETLLRLQADEDQEVRLHASLALDELRGQRQVRGPLAHLPAQKPGVVPLQRSETVVKTYGPFEWREERLERGGRVVKRFSHLVLPSSQSHGVW